MLASDVGRIAAADQLHQVTFHNSFVWKDLNELAVMQLLEMEGDTDGRLKFMSFVLGLGNFKAHRLVLVVLEFYLSTFLFARDAGFSPPQISAIFTIVKRAFDRVFGLPLSVVRRMHPGTDEFSAYTVQPTRSPLPLRDALKQLGEDLRSHAAPVNIRKLSTEAANTLAKSAAVSYRAAMHDRGGGTNPQSGAASGEANRNPLEASFSRAGRDGAAVGGGLTGAQGRGGGGAAPGGAQNTVGRNQAPRRRAGGVGAGGGGKAAARRTGDKRGGRMMNQQAEEEQSEEARLRAEAEALQEQQAQAQKEAEAKVAMSLLDAMTSASVPLLTNR